MKRLSHKPIGVHTQAGFTLVELMVSLSLFIIVVFALIGSLYTVNDASRKVQSMRIVMDNINFATESMSRTIRTSEGITCGTPGSLVNCDISTNGTTQISMNSTLGENRQVEYRWWKNPITGNHEIQKQSIAIITNTDGTQGLNLSDVRTWTAITAPEIDIQKLTFYVDGAKPLDGKQPSVIIKMEGIASVPNGTPQPFAIQTLLSQRAPESFTP